MYNLMHIFFCIELRFPAVR